MLSRTPVVKEAATVDPSTLNLATHRSGVISVLLMSGWAGLVGGLLEVGTLVLRKQVFDPDRLYKMSRHFVWLIPLSNLCVFLALGLLGLSSSWSGRATDGGCSRAQSLRLRFYRLFSLRFRGSTVWPGWWSRSDSDPAASGPGTQKPRSPAIHRGHVHGGCRDPGNPGSVALE